jgi:hypothetical protein
MQTPAFEQTIDPALKLLGYVTFLEIVFVRHRQVVRNRPSS